MHRWHARAQRDTRAIAAVLWGTRPHTAIEQAVAARTTDDAWAEQFADALDAFTEASWPQNLLTAVPPSQGKPAADE